MEYCPFSNSPCPHPKNMSISHEINGDVESFSVCQLCFAQKNHPLMPPKLAKILDMIDSVGKRALTCPGCGVGFEGIIKMKRYGCEKCYDAFKDQTLNILGKCQFGGSHIGKTPAKWEREFLRRDASIQLALLEGQLAEAIKEERYEDAILIREKVKEIKEAKDNHEV